MNTLLLQLVLTVVFFGAVATRAVTPLDAPVPEGRATEIECEYKGTEGFRTFGKAQNGVFHYRVILPTGYAKEPERRYPCIFSMTPGGGGSTGKAERWLKENQWIIIQLVEARNGPWEPIFGCFLAAHDDAVKRFRIAEGQKYATGFSGGSRASSIFIHLRSGFAGLWVQGSGFAYSGSGQWVMPPSDSSIAVYASFGTTDGNLWELNYIRKIQQPFAFEIHDGGHVAPPYEAIERIFDWFEQQLYLYNPQAKITPAQAQAFLAKRHAAYESAPTPFAKYRHALVIQKLVAKYPALAPAAEPVLRELTGLASSPAIHKEKAAEAAYRETQSSELRWRTGDRLVRGKLDPNATRNIIKLYSELAAKFPDTEFGKLAAHRAAALATGDLAGRDS